MPPPGSASSRPAARTVFLLHPEFLCCPSPARCTKLICSVLSLRAPLTTLHCVHRGTDETLLTSHASCARSAPWVPAWDAPARHAPPWLQCAPRPAAALRPPLQPHVMRALCVSALCELVATSENVA